MSWMVVRPRLPGRPCGHLSRPWDLSAGHVLRNCRPRVLVLLLSWASFTTGTPQAGMPFASLAARGDTSENGAIELR